MKASFNRAIPLGLILVLQFIVHNAWGQVNTIRLGYGFFQADENRLEERIHNATPNFVMKANYARHVYKIISIQFTTGYASYVASDKRLNPQNPTNPEKDYQRISFSLGPQIELFTWKDFHFSTGFDLGYHFANDQTVRSDRYEANYFDYSINLLNLFYQYKGFQIGIESHVGSNMYSKMFVSAGFTF
jgi:hypothetical protein